MEQVPEQDAVKQMQSGGWCSRCGRVHALPAAEPVLEACRELMGHFQRHGRIDALGPGLVSEDNCATAALFAEGGGKMFGVLACRDARGKRVLLRAFSGQFNGLWQVPGWVGPVFDERQLHSLVEAPEREIKALGQELGRFEPDSPHYHQLRRERRRLSRQLMTAIHALYTLSNFRGDSAPLVEVFLGKGLPPAGTGDCCGPKLLHHAVKNGLFPEAMAEFYWGRTNSSGTKEHGRWYSACRSKCQPILGFQLCGLS